MTFGPDGVEVRDSTDLAPDVSAAVAEVICTKDGVRVRMHNKLQALGVLAEYVELTSPAPAPIVEAGLKAVTEQLRRAARDRGAVRWTRSSAGEPEGRATWAAQAG